MSHHKASARHPRWLIEAAPKIIKHMNEDHANSITSTLNGQHGIKDKNAKMDALELHGYYIRSTDELYFVEFTKTCASKQEYKSELVKHAHLYRDFELS